MWNSNIKLDFLATNIAQAIDNYCLRGDEKIFLSVVNDIKKTFSNISDADAWQIIGLCVTLCSKQKNENAELAITAPPSFRLKARKIIDVVEDMLKNASRSITLTGYAVSDYFTEMLDTIILQSQKGVYVRLYLNDYEKQKKQLKRLMDLRSKFLRVYDYQKHSDDAMSALHAKTIVVDEKEILVSSANLSYHGMEGNIEMGIRLESKDKSVQIEEVLKEMIRMKMFVELGKE